MSQSCRLCLGTEFTTPDTSVCRCAGCGAVSAGLAEQCQSCKKMLCPACTTLKKEEKITRPSSNLDAPWVLMRGGMGDEREVFPLLGRRSN